MSHTPGPWTTTLSADARIDDRVTSANGATVLRGSITNTADARLIAAAPDLLAALQDLVLAEDLPAGYANRRVLLNAARAAIARATGE